MNKTELVDAIAEKAGLSKAEAGKALDATLDCITETLGAGDKVALLGFGTFAVNTREARIGRDPRTGNPLKIPKRTVASFKAGKPLKDAVDKVAIEA